MIDDLEILIQLIRPEATVPLEEEYGRHFVTLREPQAPDSQLTVRNLPADIIAIKVDAFTSPDAVFNGKHGECKRADYVLISPERRAIVYIEIKRTRDCFEDIVKQLMGAQCFMNYCRDVGRIFWEESGFLRDYKERFVSVGRTTLAKRKTKVERIGLSHDRPSQPLKIDSPHYIQFRQLAGS